jgi:very-short-patch-repair endonuclease
MGGQLAAWSLESGIYVEREYRFHPERRWRFDFALPDKLIACEYEGIHSEKSRHTTITGYQGDIDKYNAAQALGWKVIRFTAKTYKTVIKELEKNID